MRRKRLAHAPNVNHCRKSETQLKKSCRLLPLCNHCFRGRRIDVSPSPRFMLEIERTKKKHPRTVHLHHQRRWMFNFRLWREVTNADCDRTSSPLRCHCQAVYLGSPRVWTVPQTRAPYKDNALCVFSAVQRIGLCGFEVLLFPGNILSTLQWLNKWHLNYL